MNALSSLVCVCSQDHDIQKPKRKSIIHSSICLATCVWSLLIAGECERERTSVAIGVLCAGNTSCMYCERTVHSAVLYMTEEYMEKGVTTFSSYKILIQAKTHRIFIWTFAQSTSLCCLILHWIFFVWFARYDQWSLSLVHPKSQREKNTRRIRLKQRNFRLFIFFAEKSPVYFVCSRTEKCFNFQLVVVSKLFDFWF